jgi:DNA-binding response OmpR family regulator
MRWRSRAELRPDLILADVMMPHLDGLSLLQAVRADERLHNTPVILVTARAGEDNAIDGLLAGADDRERVSAVKCSPLTARPC